MVALTRFEARQRVATPRVRCERGLTLFTQLDHAYAVAPPLRPFHRLDDVAAPPLARLVPVVCGVIPIRKAPTTDLSALFASARLHIHCSESPTSPSCYVYCLSNISLPAVRTFYDKSRKSVLLKTRWRISVENSFFFYLLTPTTVAGIKRSSAFVCLSVCLSVRTMTQKQN